MSGPGPSEAAAAVATAASTAAPSTSSDPTEVGPSSPNGAEVASVLGTGFSAISAIVQSEDRVIAELQRRANTNIVGANKDRASVAGDSRGPYRYNGTPMVITTESWASQGRYILFWSGPANTAWNFPLRAAQEQTRSGTIYHYWRNGSRATMFDEPSVTFTFSTGNIMPVRFRTQNDSDKKFSEAVFLPPGLLDYYEFFDMLNQPKILPDGRPNFVFISYHSLLYPDIFLRGFFDPKGLSVTESSAKPANITWTSSFKIRSTEPPFWSSAQLISSWNAAMGASSAESAAQASAPTANPGPVTGQGPQG